MRQKYNPQRTIWCDLFGTYKQIQRCLDCGFHLDARCEYRDKGAIRTIKRPLDAVEEWAIAKMQG